MALGRQLVEMATQDQSHEGQKGGFFASRTNIVLIGFMAIAGFYLVTEHGAHLYGWLPWLLLLACPLMHVFMHGGHGGHSGNDSSGDGSPRDNQRTSEHWH